jgi:elongation factor Tu
MASCDVEVDVYFLPTDDGGKSNPVFSGYRPQFYFAYEHFAADFRFPDSSLVEPGRRARAEVRFAAPSYLAGRLGLASPFLVREGARIVAYGAVTRLVDLPASATAADENSN